MKSITFTDEMVRAILEGTKTQTRRPVKWPLKSASHHGTRRIFTESKANELQGLLRVEGRPHPHNLVVSPYGKPGDRLQVKDGPVLEITEVRLERVQDISIRDALDEGINCPSCGYTAKDAGIHMDHAVCVNKWLKESKVKDVGDHPVIGAFRSLWDSIYSKKPDLNWNANPFVWVVSFKVVS